MMTSTHLGAVAAATSIPSTTATGATAAPTGTNALFGVVQTTLTIGSVVPLLLAVVAVLLWLTTRRRGPGQTRSSTGSGANRTPVEHAQRLHDLGRVALLGSAFGLVLLGIGEVVVAYGTPTGLGGAFSDGVSPLLVPAVVLTVVAAALFATSRRPGR
ncbi:hypothetical protein EDF38_1732 [Frigoribacterium sp. PhB160]|uniref:hypothetical protein n=1 Tax=Frigoribacterium sp. PhB160 TaxID=2485192 RepID=UPI000F4A1D30|nr:hypothetical protein [Frigoribacterium sp. PhB160]ROS62620.1 hypothetical protein EDF38_1732 [Frigoribacterium sp. PhB160]